MKNFCVATQEGTLTLFHLRTGFFFFLSLSLSSFFFLRLTDLSLESQCGFCSDYFYELALLDSDWSSTSPFAELGR